MKLSPLKFANISLDPSKIRDRWGLAALVLVVWLIIAYVILSKPALKSEVTLLVLIFTLVLLFLVLALSFKPDVRELSKPSPNIPPRHKRTSPEQTPTPEEIKYLHELTKLAQHPAIKQLLKEKFKDTQ